MKNQKIEAIYPLSAMQQGLLFHTVYEGGRGIYYEQMSCRFEGRLDVEAFKRAWQGVVDRHAILRTSFVWEGVKEPVQVVQQGLTLQFREEDWRESDRAEQSRKLEELLREEREQGFELTRPPLMKMGLVRVGEDAYYFTWGNHHILFDGWCRELIIGEVFKFYDAYSQGREVEIERVRPYRDYIVWLGEQNLRAAEEFWREELRGIEGPTELGIERIRESEEGEYEEKNVWISEEVSRRLEEVARKWQVTLNTVVEGAWAVVMSRYSGQREVVFGATVSGRGGGLKGIEGMVGLFINTLPVRVEVRGEERVRELMRRVQEKQSRVQKYEHSPLIEVQGWSEAPRGVPLFRAAFMFQNYPLDAGIRAQATSSLRISESQRFSSNNYDLVIRAIPGKELLLNTIYDCGRFEAGDAERLLNHLRRVLEGMAENAQTRVMELPMMSEQEREEVVVEWNQTATEYPRDRCAHELYEQQVDVTPEAVAVVYEGEQLTYDELNRRANQLAHHLREMGVGADVKVGLCVGRSVQMIVGLLGVMKAGGAYLPLDSGYPRERLGYMIEDSGCPVIVTTRHLLEQLPVSWAQIVMIDEDWPAIAEKSDGNPQLTTVSANLAYMIYTSGSTGKPKGVGLTHQGLCNLSVAQKRNLQVSAGGTVLQFASFSFDAATWEWLMTLTCGAKLILISEADVQMPEKVLELIVTHEVETVTLPPSVLMSAAKTSIPTLKTMIVAGEACPNELVRQWSGECRFVNAYGPTESTVCATMTGAMVYGEKAGIGRAIENTQIYILGRNQEPLPAGVTGEIYIAGEGLGRGYLNRSDLTAEKFKANPFARGERMYRSGDLGRYQRDGSVEYLGRLDDQVKVRGYRIELGEIEAVLNEHPAVEQVIVVAREDEPGEKRLVGYVVARQEVSSQELRDYLQETLPDYMVPGAIVQLEEMPLTANGKIDRRALPKPELSGTSSEYVGPRTAVEEIVSGIWAEVLKVEKVGIHDNFFELGGHSLLATQVVSRVRNVLGVEVPLRKLFTDPTAAAMAGEVEVQQQGGGEGVVAAITKVAGDGELPLSYAQQRLWFIDQMEPGSATYNIPFAVRLKGRLDEQALQKSLGEIVQRHEVLRTSFPSRDGEPRQEIHEFGELLSEVSDLSHNDAAEREAQLQQVLREETSRGFDLSKGPLIRAKLIRMEEEEQVLLVNMHHIVSDGWSMEVMVRELAQLYEAFSQGSESPLEGLEIQYADYAVWQREWLQGKVLESRLQYWREQLDGVAVLDLPTDWSRPAVAEYRGARERIQLSTEATEKLRQMSQREGVTLFMTLLTGFQALLSRYSGQEDIAVGTPIAGRNRREIEGLIGFFVNTLVMRVNVGGNPTIRELLGRVRETALGAYAHQDVPFEKLVEELQPERSLSRTPLFQVMIAMQNVPREASTVSGLILKGEPLEAESAKFELTLTLMEAGDGIAGILEYSTDLYEKETIRRMSRHYEIVMEEIAGDPEERIRRIELLSGSERDQILFRWNETTVEYPRTRSIYELFEEQVNRTPDAMAVVFNNQGLTYRELNTQANGLAQTLVERGVGQEVLVAVLAERRLDFLITLLAIFKAGGAYLPLDPHHPAKRIGQALGLSGAALVLTSADFGPIATEAIAGLITKNQPTLFFLEEPFQGLHKREKLQRHFRPDQLAYVIFTSGSTGVPKGAMIEQRGMLNQLYAKIGDLALDGNDVVAQTASQCFDISVWQFLAALLVGGQVQIFDEETTHSPARLLEQIEQRGVTILETVPSMMRMMLTEADRRVTKPDLSMLRWLIPTGEALPPELCRQWFRLYPEVPLMNAYGPTECSDDVTHCPIEDVLAESAARSPIGRPIGNTQIYVLNLELEPQPIGVAGELYVGGEGVGRGYLNEPGKTAHSFVPNGFGIDVGARLYRSGDLARYLPDGNLEYLGRVDHQVKIHGFRIELGEIEAMLSEHGAVEQAVVVAREDQPGEKRLVAYVVKAGDPEASYEQERSSSQKTVTDWHSVFEEVYGNQELMTEDSLINPRVWINSYTDQSFPEEEIVSCVEDTVSRILALKPRRVLEIGCGTGLILSRVAPECEVYFGTDFSERALSQSRGHLRRLGLEEKVKLFEQAADDLRGMPAEYFDVVILNEVVQYFPSIEYLLRILDQLPGLVVSESSIFLGGLRNLDLWEAFRASVEVTRAPGSMKVEELRGRIAKKMRREKELLIAPGFFGELKNEWPWIEQVELELKGSGYVNELVKYRYDAILRVGAGWSEKGARTSLDWDSDGLSVESLRRALRGRNELLEVQRIPNSRVQRDAKILRLLEEMSAEQQVEELREELGDLDGAGKVNPQQLWELGRELGYRVTLSWPSSGELGAYRAIFQGEVEKRKSENGKRDLAELKLVRNWNRWKRYANQPLQDAVGKEQVKQWKEYLGERLPEYMVPAVFVELEKLPLTPNGKLDRKALRAPERGSSDVERGYEAPRTLAEQRLAEIWSQVLGVDRVGVNDDFFEMGGHSLLATQVISRVRAVLEVELPLRALFESPRLSELAVSIEQARMVARGLHAPPFTKVSREGELPLSYAQQRLWFIDQLDPGSPAYNIPLAVRLRGRLDADALSRSLNEIVARHEVLRTSFPSRGGRPRQEIHEFGELQPDFIDLMKSDEAERQEKLRAVLQDEARRGFDLSGGPLIRAKLIRLAVEEHVLAVTMHHIVSDGWSLTIMVKEISQLYEAFTEGRESPLPELKIQYADFAVWQRQWLTGDVFAEEIGYWREHLSGLEPLELPLDYQRPALAGYRGASLNFELSEELVEGLAALSRREGVTLFMTVLAAFQTLLMRYSGQEDVAVGSPIANRTRAETEGLIGFFVNTLVLRTQVEGKSSFQELLARVREVCLDAYSYQDLPFEHIVEHLQPERDLSRQPLFQVMFALQNAAAATPELPGLGLSSVEIPVETSKFDLFLSAVEAEGHWLCTLNYDTDLFDPATIGRMSEHLRALLGSVVANPLTPLSAQRLLSPDEHRLMLFEWNQTAVSFSPNCCIHQLVESQVARTPEAVAVCTQEWQLSYRELNARANRIADRLRMLGIGPEKVVGICSERSVEMLVWVLGILKAGGAYLPLDPAYPQERLSFMVNDSGVEALVTNGLLANKFSEYQGTVIFLEECIERSEESEVNSGVETDWDCPAYVIYTSGSTGKPKGVTMVHRALTNLIRWQLDHPSYSRPMRTLQFSSLSFDVSFQEIFATWCAGGRLVLIDEETHRDPVRLWEALGADEVERLFLPFVALQQLAEAAENGGAAGVSLRRIVTAGEALKVTPQIETMLGRLTDCILENQYGPTESHVVSSYSLPPMAAQRVKKLPPIGRPIANTEIYILDNWMNPVPVGVIGDLHLGGACLARGYLSQPTPTAEKFIPAPFSEEFGARLYRTGDRARYLPNGDVEFMGRRDDQVKVRGYRIELGEVEANLAEAPSVRECAVAVRKDDSGNGCLVGYVVSHEGEAIAVSELRHFLQHRLPEYMVPSSFVHLNALPVTASGKVDRRALPAPEKNVVNEGTRVSPRTAIEELVTGILEEVLKLDRVGIDDNFFEIGGHSLLATQVISRVRNTFGVEIGVRSIFQSPTVEGMARKIEGAMRDGEKDEAPPLVRVSREEKLPLSFAQQRLWFMDQLEPGSAAYNLPCAVRLRGRLDVDALRKSLNEIVTRHEVLRTGFPSESGEPRQDIQEGRDLQPEFIDLTQSDEAGQEQKLQQVLQDEAKRGFDLACVPLIRTKLIRLAEDDHVLIVNMHHIVSDGWSIVVIVREFAQLYEAFSQGLESPLPEPEIQYADYAMWQREWLQGEVLDRQLQYWRRQLEGLGVLELPTDRPRLAAASYRGASERIWLSEELTQKLRQMSRREGVTLFMSLLAGFHLLLARYSGQEDIAIGTPIAGRNRVETEGLIGLFLNTLVMRVNVGGNPSVRELVARVREAALGAYAHQDLPFEKLVEEIRPERSLSHQPLFKVWFVLQNVPFERVDLPGLSVESLPVDDSFTKFDLMLSLSEGQKELTGTLRYSTDLFDRRRIKRMLSHYESILEGMAADEEPDSKEHDVEREQYQCTAIN